MNIGMADGAAPTGLLITFLFLGGYKAVVPTGPGDGLEYRQVLSLSGQ
jgi:hypothetical protein